MRNRLLLLHGAIVVFLLAPPAHLPRFAAITRIDASVVPVLSYAPTTVRVKVTIEPAADNRSLTIEVEGLQVFESSEVPLDGDRASRVHQATYADLPPGQYIVRARLHDARGETSQATARFQVLPRT